MSKLKDYLLLLFYLNSVYFISSKTLGDYKFQFCNYQERAEKIDEARNTRSLSDSYRSRSGQRPALYNSIKKWNNAYSRPISWKLERKNIPNTYYDDGSTPYDEVLKVFQTAFNLWSKKVKIRFKQVSHNNGAEIVISFVRLEHDCTMPFKGEGGAVAHAFQPGHRSFFSSHDGDLHVDIDENWFWKIKALKHMFVNDYRNWIDYTNGRGTIDRRKDRQRGKSLRKRKPTHKKAGAKRRTPPFRYKRQTADILQSDHREVMNTTISNQTETLNLYDDIQPMKLMYTAIHEIGHSLGLIHSFSNDSIMYGFMEQGSFIKRFDPENPIIPEMDYMSLINIYGARRKEPLSSQNIENGRTTSSIRDKSKKSNWNSFFSPTVIIIILAALAFLTFFLIVFLKLRRKCYKKKTQHTPGVGVQGDNQTDI